MTERLSRSGPRRLERVYSPRGDDRRGHPRPRVRPCILTAQTGLFSSSKRAATMSQAVGLARCKMGEIEEELLREGFQLTARTRRGLAARTRRRASLQMVDHSGRFARSSQAGSADAGAGTESPSDSLDALGEASDSLASGDTAGAIGGLTAGERPPAAPRWARAPWLRWRWGSSTLSSRACSRRAFAR